MTTSLGSCIGLKSPAVSKFREPYGLCCTNNISSTHNNKTNNGIGPINHNNYTNGTNGHFSNSCNNNQE